MDDLDEETFRLVMRLVGLIQVAHSSWTAEDEAFFRNVRNMIQKRRDNGASSGEQLEREGGDAHDFERGAGTG